MIEVPKLVLILVIGFLVWYALRWVNGAASKSRPRRQAPPPPRQPAVEDLVACRKCGAYVATGAPACGRPGCPQPG